MTATMHRTELHTFAASSSFHIIKEVQSQLVEIEVATKNC